MPVAALDIAHKLLVEDQVVVCKMNPVNAWAGPFIRCFSRAREAPYHKTLKPSNHGPGPPSGVAASAGRRVYAVNENV